MSTGRNLVESPFRWVSMATDSNGEEGQCIVIQADQQYEVSSDNAAADGAILSVDTEGADGSALAYFGSDPVRLKAGATFNEGAWLTVSSGKLIATTTGTHIVVARALEASGAANEFVLVKPMFPGVEYASLDGA